jgi:hypothetical protein
MNRRTQIASSNRKARDSHHPGLAKGNFGLRGQVGFIWPLFCAINDLRDADGEARVIGVNKCYIGVNSIEFKSREKALNEGSKDRDTGGISVRTKLFFLGRGNERVKSSRDGMILMYGHREIRMKRLAESGFFSRRELVMNKRIGYRSNRFSKILDC